LNEAYSNMKTDENTLQDSHGIKSTGSVMTSVDYSIPGKENELKFDLHANDDFYYDEFKNPMSAN